MKGNEMEAMLSRSHISFGPKIADSISKSKNVQILIDSRNGRVIGICSEPDDIVLILSAYAANSDVGDVGDVLVLNSSVIICPKSLVLRGQKEVKKHIAEVDKATEDAERFMASIKEKP
jgi:hypothetical protein